MRVKTIDAPKRIIKISEVGIRKASQDLDEKLKELPNEANINVLVAYKNKEKDLAGEIRRAANRVITSRNSEELGFFQNLFEDIIKTAYPDCRFKEGDFRTYQPYQQMQNISNLIATYKKISLDAYDKIETVMSVLKFNSFTQTYLDNSSLHFKAARKMRKYIQLT